MTVATDRASITCPQCGWVSYNPNDVVEKYCGNCHQYHDTMLPLGTDCGECGNQYGSRDWPVGESCHGPHWDEGE